MTYSQLSTSNETNSSGSSSRSSNSPEISDSNKLERGESNTSPKAKSSRVKEAWLYAIERCPPFYKDGKFCVGTLEKKEDVMHLVFYLGTTTGFASGLGLSYALDVCFLETIGFVAGGLVTNYMLWILIFVLIDCSRYLKNNR